MSGTVRYSNIPNVPFLDFDLSKIKVDTDYNIIFHYVFNPFGNFESEFDFLKDPTLDENTLVILWHAVEMGVWVQDWIDKLNRIVLNAPFKLIYLTGCSSRLDLDKFFNIGFDINFFPAFDIRGSDLWAGVPTDITIDKSHKFCCLNAKDVPHRRFVFSQLFKNDLLKDGVVSYKCTNWGVDFNPDFFYFFEGQGFTESQLSEFKNSYDLVTDLIPINIDNNNVASKLPRDIFLDSYLNVVGETDFVNVPHSFTQGFVTEKTFNAMANNQMFIVVGHATSLQTIRDMGYKTFDGIIDERYDTIMHNGDRLIAVRDEVLRFLNRPIEEIRADYIRAQDIISYNRDRLFSQNLNARFQQLVNNI